MPAYTATCPIPACGRVFTAFTPESMRFLVECDQCGAPGCKTEPSEERPPGRTVARITKTTCFDCQHTWEPFARAEDGWVVLCPECGKPCRAGRAERPSFNGNRRFSGSESVSLMEGCHPAEVQSMRRLMPEVQHCIKDGGRVEFSDRSEQRKYARAIRRVEGVAGP